MSEILEYRNVCKSFDEKQVLKNVNLKISRNKIVGLLGLIQQNTMDWVA